MTAGTADKVALYWYAEPSILTHMTGAGVVIIHTRTHAHELHARNTHTNTCNHARTQQSHVHTQPRTHATLTRTHACTHHMTNTHSHAQVLNLHVHVHT